MHSPISTPDLVTDANATGAPNRRGSVLDHLTSKRIMEPSNITSKFSIKLHRNPDLQLPAGAPLDSDGDPYYGSAEEVRAFLVCLTRMAGRMDASNLSDNSEGPMGDFSSNDDSEDDVSMGSGASDSELSGSEGDGLSDENSGDLSDDGAGDSAESDEDF